jgi:hypothetical protein
MPPAQVGGVFLDRVQPAALFEEAELSAFGQTRPASVLRRIGLIAVLAFNASCDGSSPAWLPPAKNSSFNPGTERESDGDIRQINRS